MEPKKSISEESKDEEWISLVNEVPLNLAIDKEQFTKKFECLCVGVPVHRINSFLKKWNNYLLSLPNKKKVEVLDPNQPEIKHVIFSQDIRSKEDLPEELQSTIKSENYDIRTHLVTTGYEELGVIEALRVLLMPEMKGMEQTAQKTNKEESKEQWTNPLQKNFEVVGHIAHLDLRDHLLKYKFLIGKIILDKNKGSVQTVVNKVSKLNNVYRTPRLELLAGVPQLTTQVKEGGARFKLDFSKTYWCSRLQGERDRMIEKYFKPGETICDMFCGVGPMIIRTALQNKCFALGNDLNPECFKYLNENIQENAVSGRIKSYCMDAREFLNMAIQKPKAEDERNHASFRLFQHVFMNLPGTATNFLDVFIGFLRKADLETWNQSNLPLIHVYCFIECQTEPEGKRKAAERIKSVLKHFDEKEIIDFHQVKNISSKKSMFGVTFKLSNEVAMAEPIVFEGLFENGKPGICIKKTKKD